VGALDGLWTFDPPSFDEAQPVASAPNQTGANGFSKRKSLRHIDRRQGLSNDRIASLWVDYENNLWIGTWGGGACKLFGNYLENYLTSNGLPAASVYSFLEDQRSRIWIGTNGGGLAIAAGDSLFIRDTRHGLPHNVIRALDREPSGAIWIGTDAGAVRVPSAEAIFNPKSWQVFTKKNGLLNDRINDLFCAANGEVWLATGGAGALCYSGGHFKALTAELGLPGNTIEAIHRDRQGRLWIATIDGLFLQDGQAEKVFRRHDNSLPFEDVYCIFEDRNGYLWFGARRGGAALYDNGVFRVLNSANGLSNDVVYFINEDRNGRLWFGTNAGVDGFEKASLLNFLKRRETSSTHGYDSTAPVQNDSSETIAPFFHLEVVHGLADKECNARATLGDRLGNLWFGTASGATKLYPDLLPLATAPPRVDIQAIEADGQFFAFRDALQLKVNSSLTFHFRTLSFINEKYTRSQYYLEGFENTWPAPAAADNARYTNLPPGKYAFHLRGANAYGVASIETAPLRFKILPPVYRTPWFLLSGLLLFGGLIYGGLRWRLRQMHKRNADLQMTVAEKTHNLKEANEFLASIKESLPVGLILVDAKRFVIEANRSGAELFGYENSASLFGQEIHNLLTSDKMTRDMLWAALREEKRAKLSAPNGQLEVISGQSGLEIDGLRRDGKKIPCRVHTCSVEDERGNLRYIILTCEDISERRQLEQNLVENQKQLALLDLLAGMGDILNNKLTGVQGYLDLLRNALTKGVARREDSGESTPVNPVEVVNWAHSSAGEMNAILRQLIEFGTYIAKVQAVPLDLREVLQALERRWNKIISVKLPEMPASIWASVVQKIKAGLDEAIRNSREAEATEVVVNIEKMEAQSRIRLILTDNGRGISPELVSKVFLPFFKTKATAHPGLGLWKLRQLVQQSGGSVEINFVPKGGTQLVIILPMATSEQLADKANGQTNGGGV
jgi:PAS domain S-box-containing protein